MPGKGQLLGLVNAATYAGAQRGLDRIISDTLADLDAERTIRQTQFENSIKDSERARQAAQLQINTDASELDWRKFEEQLANKGLQDDFVRSQITENNAQAYRLLHPELTEKDPMGGWTAVLASSFAAARRTADGRPKTVPDPRIGPRDTDLTPAEMLEFQNQYFPQIGYIPESSVGPGFFNRRDIAGGGNQLTPFQTPGGTQVGAATTAGQETDLAEIAQILQTSAAIAALPDDQIGGLRGRYNEWALAHGLDASTLPEWLTSSVPETNLTPEVIAANQAIQAKVQLLSKLMSGLQLQAGERPRMEAQTPAWWQSPAQFRANDALLNERVVTYARQLLELNHWDPAQIEQTIAALQSGQTVSGKFIIPTLPSGLGGAVDVTTRPATTPGTTPPSPPGRGTGAPPAAPGAAPAVRGGTGVPATRGGGGVSFGVYDPSKPPGQRFQRRPAGQ